MTKEEEEAFCRGFTNGMKEIEILKADKDELKQEISTHKQALRCGDSMLKIAHNDIAAFLVSEDRMKEEILKLRKENKHLKAVIAQIKYRKEFTE